MAEAPQGAWQKNSQMERWRFALPTEFRGHLPPLIESTQQLEGDGNWRSNVVRDKLSADLSSRKNAGNEVVFQIEAGELRLNGKLFGTAKLAFWQQSGWKQAIRAGKKSGPQDSHSKRPPKPPIVFCPNWPPAIGPRQNSSPSPCEYFVDRRLMPTHFATRDGNGVCWQNGGRTAKTATGSQRNHTTSHHISISRRASRTAA